MYTIKFTGEFKRHTKAELNAMLDEAEAEIAAGGGIPDEEAWDDLEEEINLEKHHTKAELNAMLDEAEARFEAGLGIPHEEVMREMDEEIERWEQAYKLASTIKRSMKQAETAPAMTVEQAMRHLEEL